MRCRCCDRLLSDAESKARDPNDRSQFLDLCNICRYKSNYYLDEEEVLKKEDIHIDYG
jgi:hypothetical protein